jgi:hypothetical protein
VEEALKPSRAELDQALKEAKAETAYASLVADKTRLAEEGKAHAAAVLKEIEAGPGVGLIVDYSALGSPQLGMAFTPFGIRVVDGERTVFSRMPLKVTFGQAGELAQKVPMPLLRDAGRRLIRFRLPQSATRAEVEKALGSPPTSGGAVAKLALDLPGFTVKAAKAQIRRSGENLTIVLLKGSEEK